MTPINIQPVPPDQTHHFRELVEDYWWEIMPTARGVRDRASRYVYFKERFRWEDGVEPPWWAVDDEGPIAFVAFTASGTRADIHDFYVCPRVRRRGVGSRLVTWLMAELDRRGVKQVDLNVRRDNPASLAFGSRRDSPSAITG